jgi:lipoate-protein ligase A
MLLIVSPGLSGARNMEFDRQFFHDCEAGLIPAALRIYSWRPNCITVGYAQKIKEEIDVDRAVALGYDVVQRPTGGGIVFHNEAEVTYSLVVPFTDPLLPKGLVASYKVISEALVLALKKLGVSAEIRNTKYDRACRQAGILNKSEALNSKSPKQLCFAYPAEYEIVAEGKKLVGSAQKRGKNALLQQGSIFVRQPEAEVFSVLKKPYSEHNAVSLEELLGRRISFEALKEALIAGFRDHMNLSKRSLDTLQIGQTSGGCSRAQR